MRNAAAVSGKETEVRVAVVVGNSAYPAGALSNPRNDATAIFNALKKLGFDVELKLDATKDQMDEVFRRFSGKTAKANVALVFYAGHGIQVNGNNYIIPIDANPKSERDLKRDMIKMDDVIDDMGDARIKLVFFDACRDNPLARSFSRGGSRGMAAPVEASGTLISFATKHGNTASDGEGSHSPYTTALLAAMENPVGVEIEQMLRRVQQNVRQATNGQQEPWRYGSLDGDFYFKVGESPADTAKAQQEAVDRAIAEAIQRANEQASRELQKSISAQQVATDHAVAEAIRRSNEQAARERTELQQSMEKMLKEALARQNATLEAERLARQAVNGGAQSALPRPAPDATTGAPAAPPMQLSSIAPGTALTSVMPPAKASAPLTNAAGDEWEYLARDEMFGKKQKLVLRVKAVSAEGVLEEIVWNGKPITEGLFGKRAAALGTPNQSEFMFSPHWNGDGLSAFYVEGGVSQCVGSTRSCILSLKVSGTEKLTVAAGTFDAIRLDGWIRILDDMANPNPGRVTIWYSKDHRRLLKQTAEMSRNRSIFYKETLELSAVRPASRSISATPSAAQNAPPVQVSVVAPAAQSRASRSLEDAAAALTNAPGDEWEYLANDEMFGRKQKLVLRVKAASSEGVLEEIIWNGKPIEEWVFDGRAAALGTPNQSEFMFSPHWNGNALSDVLVQGGKGRCTIDSECVLSLKLVGNEKLTVAAGTFEAIRLEGWLKSSLTAASGGGNGRVTIWYSKEHRRLLKQSAEMRSHRVKYQETLELSAVRPTLR
ncbi:MAG: caspase family protein [Burkholderiaceae bacterium]|nr:caspase family protein [Sulfuritalea sp.]MCF8176598.1 caspase family protein [Burkholderiaceae bacterium]